MKVVHVLRKPCSESTVAANALRWGTGAINIDGSRISALPGEHVSTHARSPEASAAINRPIYGEYGPVVTRQTEGQKIGRWPANLLLQHLDGCAGDVCGEGCPVAALDAQSGVSKSTGGRIGNASGAYTNQGSTGWSGAHRPGDPGFGDVGGASRFFKQFGGSEP